MKKFIACMYMVLVILGQNLSAQEYNYQKGDSLRVIMKSGIYNYGIFSNQTDSTLNMFVDNQISSTTLYKNRIAEIKLFPKAVPAVIETPKTQNIDPNNQSLSSNVYSSTAKLRVGDNIEIRVRSGMIIKGVVTKNMVSSIKLKTEDSELTIPKSDIKQLVNLRELKNDLEILNMNSNPESSNFSRYFFAPSAIKNKSGTFVYDNSYLFVNSLTYSPTDFLSITGSAEIITLLAAQPMYMIAPHMGFKFADGFYIGGGFMHFNMINEDIKLNVLFGTVTVGDQNRNATLNIGRGTQANSDYSINLSGFLRVSKNFGIITENWFSPALNFIDEDVPLLGVGGRLMSKNVNFDFALITFIPYIGFSVRF